MLQKSDTISLVKKSLIGYNDVVLTQIDNEISDHNILSSSSQSGHMSSEQFNKLNGIESGAQVNQNAISTLAMGDAGTVTATTPTSTAKFIAGSNISYSVDSKTGEITINSTNTTYNTVSTTDNGLAPKITNTSGFLKGDGTWVTINKAYVSLGNVTNESKATMFTNPTFTGTVTVPALTDSSTDNQAANKKYVDTKVASLVDSAPEALDTLNELATALGNDANFATTVSSQIGTKADKTTVNTLSATVGNSSSGLVKDVNTLKTTVGSSTSGLVKKVNDNTTAISNAITTSANTAQSKVDELANGQVTTNKNDIATINTAIAGFGDSTIKDYIDGQTYLTYETVSDAEIFTLIDNVRSTVLTPA